MGRLDPDQVQKTRGAGRQAAVTAANGPAQLAPRSYQKQASGRGNRPAQGRACGRPSRGWPICCPAAWRKRSGSRAPRPPRRARRTSRRRRDWERAQMLYKNEDISTAQRDQYRARFDSTAAAVKPGRKRLALVVEGPRKEDIEIGPGVTGAGQGGAAPVARRGPDLRAQGGWSKRAVPKSTGARAIGGSWTRSSTTPGRVADDGYVLARRRSRAKWSPPGASVVKSATWIAPGCAATSPKATWAASNWAQGTAASERDSYPGKEYWGRVSFIASEAEFTPKQIQTPEERVKLVYRIKIDVDNPRLS